MTKRRFLLNSVVIVFLAAICISNLSGGEDGKNILAWQVTEDGIAGKVYLIGSIHLAPESTYPLDEAYDHMADEADLFAFEIYKINAAKTMAFSLRNGRYHDGSTIEDRFGKEAFGKISAYLAKYGIGEVTAKGLNFCRPWLIIMLVQTAPLDTLGFKPGSGFEDAFRKEAEKKSGISLETEEIQVKALADADESEVMKAILDQIDDEEKFVEEIKETVEAFSTGDASVLARQNDDDKKEYPSIYFNLSVRRNEAMAEKIYSLMKQGKTLAVIVGAAHLAGEDSINAILQKKGCKIVQVEALGRKGRIKP